MNRIFRILPAAALLAVTVFGAAGSPAAAARPCPPNPPPGSTIIGDIVLVNFQNCTLANVTVTGSITGGKDSGLTLQNATVLHGLNVTDEQIFIINSTIDGNVSPTARFLDICGSHLNGAVLLTGGGTTGLPYRIGDPGEAIPSGPSDCPGNTINGSLTVNDAENIEIEGNHIVGTNALTLNGFSGEFAGNTIHGNATCTSDTFTAIDADSNAPNTYSGTD